MFQKLGEAQQPKPGDSLASLCDRKQATAAATIILGSYKRSDVDDPQIFIANAVAVLMRYSPEIVRDVCDPGGGIQTRLNWPPTVAELRAECERVAGEHATRQRREMLNRHRVLLDTPSGLRPESEVTPEALLLAGPPGSTESAADSRQQAYEYAMQVKEELKRAGEEQDPNKPPPGMTEAQKRKWHAERLEERLSELRAHNETVPVVIGEELARKIAAIRADYERPLQAAE